MRARRGVLLAAIGAVGVLAGQQAVHGQRYSDQGYRYDQQQRSDQSMRSRDMQTRSWAASETRVIRASNLIGREVRNWSNQELGTITDLAINRRQGQVVYAVLSTGGFLGIGDRMHAVPFPALKLSTDNRQFILDASQSQLKNAQGFDKNEWPDRPEHFFISSVQGSQQQDYRQPQYRDRDDGDYPEDRSNVYSGGQIYRRDHADQAEITRQQQYRSRYDGAYDRDFDADRFPQRRDSRYEVYGYDDADQNAPRYQQQYGQGTQRPDRGPPEYDDQSQRWQGQGEYQPPRGGQQDQRRDMGDAGWRDQQQWRRDDMTWRNRGDSEGQARLYDGQGGAQPSVDWATDPDQHWANRVSQIIGSDVQDAQSNDAGEIDDLAIDLREGRIVYAIVDPSGQLEVGANKLVAVPWTRVQLDASNGQLLVNADKQALQRAAFDANEWPNLADASWGRTIFMAYGEQPYWQTYGYQGYEQDMQSQQQMQGDQQRQQGQTYQGQPKDRQHQGGQQSQQRQDPDSQRYDSNKEVTLTGKITSVQTQSADGQQVLRIRLETQGQPRTVRLGPASQLRDRLNLRQDQQVQVVGSQVQSDGQTVLIARQIRVDGKTHNLRDMQGRWTFQEGSASAGQQK